MRAIFPLNPVFGHEAFKASHFWRRGKQKSGIEISELQYLKSIDFV